MSAIRKTGSRICLTILCLFGFMLLSCRLIPSETSDTKEFRNVPYAQNTQSDDAKWQTLDMYIPGNHKNAYSAILFIHGGGWKTGDKSEYAAPLIELSNPKNTFGGLITAAMNYRMLPAADGTSQGATSYTDMLHDIDDALRLMQQLAKKNGAEIKNVVLMGSSAGAHLALLYAYTHTGSVPGYNKAPIEIAFVISQSGPADLTAKSFYTSPHQSWLGVNVAQLIGLTGMIPISTQNSDRYHDLLKNASPVTYISMENNIPPTLIAHGAKDEIVPIENADSLAKALAENGKPYQYYRYPSSGHDLNHPQDSRIKDAFFEAIMTWFQRYSKQVD